MVVAVGVVVVVVVAAGDCVGERYRKRVCEVEVGSGGGTVRGRKCGLPAWFSGSW